MHKIFILLILGLLLSSCMFVTKMDIEQGNIVTPCMVSQIHRGMSKAQVVSILGTPTLLNTFNENRMDYIYTFKAGHGQMMEKRLTLLFNHRGALQDIIY